jgi:hypothetical protein
MHCARALLAHGKWTSWAANPLSYLYWKASIVQSQGAPGWKEGQRSSEAMVTAWPADKSEPWMVVALHSC